jgi:hypothetical protein
VPVILVVTTLELLLDQFQTGRQGPGRGTGSRDPICPFRLGSEWQVSVLRWFRNRQDPSWPSVRTKNGNDCFRNAPPPSRPENGEARSRVDCISSIAQAGGGRSIS